MKTLTLHLSDDTAEQLEALAEKRGVGTRIATHDPAPEVTEDRAAI